MNLKKRTLNGLFWVGLEKVGLNLVQVVVFILLARLLTPEDFGLVGMIAILFSISTTLMEGGLNQAIIRESTLEKNDVDTAFFTNVILGVFFYLVIYMIAPYVSIFYDDDRLTLLIRIMGLSVFFKSFGLVYSAILAQQLNFRKELVIMLPAYLISGILAVYMAFADYGVVSLAMHYVVLELVKSLFLYFLSNQKVRLRFDKKSFKKLLSFGIYITGSKLIASTHYNLYKVLIGKFYSASVLGLYTEAQKIKRLLSSKILEAIQKVTYPTLSKIKDNNKRLKNGYRKIIQLSMLIIMPMMTVLILIADPLIPFFLGEKWLGAVPMLQIISIGGMVFYLILIYQNLLMVINRTDILFKLELIQKINTTTALIAGLWFDILILITLIIGSHFITTIIYAYKVGKYIDYTFKEQFKDISDIIFISLVVLSSLYLLKPIIVGYVPQALILIMILVFSALFMFVGIGLLTKSKKINLIRELLRK